VQQSPPFNFGLVVAYLVPGFVVLWGASYLSPILRTWLATPPDNLPTVGGLLYVTVASLAAGMTISAIRWAVFDTLHHRTGVAPPRWDFATLPAKLEAYHALIEIHYRYYQLHSHLFVALAFAYGARFFATPWWAYRVGVVDLGFIIVSVVLFLASRDALRKYYRRAGELLKPSTSRKGGEKHVERRQSARARRSQDRRAEGAEERSKEAQRQRSEEAGSSEVTC
jgi:hypothetical protein